jgi:hypothetical protein
MVRTASIFLLCATLFGCMLASAAQAQNGPFTRTFVSASGTDANPCTVVAPCATFAHAYTQVQSSGIVTALDPGKYGPLTILGPVTIDGNGWASITAPANGPGIGISANAGDIITLKGLTIEGVGTAADGVSFNTGGGLNVFNCTIKNTKDNGIYVSVITGMTLLVSNTFISNVNAAPASSGIYVYDGSPSNSNGNVSVTLDHLIIDSTNNGLSLYANSRHVVVHFSNGVISNGGNAFTAQGTEDQWFAYLTLRNIQLSNNTNSINLLGYTFLFLSQVIEGNFDESYNTQGSGNTIYCDGTNHIAFSCGQTWTLK